MDWPNEHYIRVYTRDTTTWKRLRWSGQSVLMAVLRKLDAAGVMDIEDVEPWEAVELHCGAPQDVAQEGMEACLRLGVLIHEGNHLIAPKFIEAQWANKSDKQRQKESRDRRRADVLVTNRDGESQNVTPGGGVTNPDAQTTPRDDGVTPRDGPVTKRDAGVTRGHTRSHAVTPPPSAPSAPNATPPPLRVVDEESDTTLSWQQALIVVAEVAGIDMSTVSLARWRVEGSDIIRFCKGDETELRRVAAVWAEDGWVQKNKPVFDHLAKRWPKYAAAGAGEPDEPIPPYHLPFKDLS